MKPERIASLLASATEILYGIGLGDRVVAVSHECDFPPEAAEKPRATRTHVDADASSQVIDRQVRESAAQGRALYEVDFDLLAQLAPELIVTQAQCDVCAVSYTDVVEGLDRYESLQQTRVVALNPMTLDDIFADIRRVGRATDSEAEAQQYVGSLLQRVDAIRRVAQTISPQRRPRVACLEWIDPPMLAANWMPQLIDLAGGVHPHATRTGEHSTTTPWQAVVDYEPQVLVIVPCGFDLERTLQESQMLSTLPGWSSLPAVRDGRVFAADGNAYFNRSGPRIVDSLEILAHLTHPDLFPPPALCEPTSQVWQPLGG